MHVSHFKTLRRFSLKKTSRKSIYLKLQQNIIALLIYYKLNYLLFCFLQLILAYSRLKFFIVVC